VEKGYLSFVLHAHLPFVRHPEHDDFLEEDWLYEAITETYIPLIDMMEDLLAEGVVFRLVMSLSPPLCEMLADELLQNRYLRYIDKRIDLSRKEVERTRGHELFNKTARLYLRSFEAARRTFVERCGCNLVTAFRSLQDRGVLEVLTVSATHGILPLMHTDEAKRAQVRAATANYRKHFGTNPRGIWLAECAYAPGLDSYLKEQGIRFFVLDSHGVLYGRPMPRMGVYAPVYTPNGVAAFARDVESSKQVWSREEGYPGDFVYREFYRDLGYDGPYDYVRPYLHPDGVRRNLGVKYFKITGKVGLDGKKPYDPDVALDRAAVHAANFLFNRQHQARHLNVTLGRKPIILSPYDAELFGHWWLEGPQFLRFLFKKIHYDQDDLSLVTLSEYLRANPTNQVVLPAASSWGDKGYFEVWLNGANDWIYKHLHQAEERMIELVAANPQPPSALIHRALNQTARELLLAQSSDWAFIMTTGTNRSYAEKRTRDHLARMFGLYLQIKENRLEQPWLEYLEGLDNIFPELDYRIYR